MTPKHPDRAQARQPGAGVRAAALRSDIEEMRSNLLRCIHGRTPVLIGAIGLILVVDYLLGRGAGPG